MRTEQGLAECWGQEGWSKVRIHREREQPGAASKIRVGGLTRCLLTESGAADCATWARDRSDDRSEPWRLPQDWGAVDDIRMNSDGTRLCAKLRQGGDWRCAIVRYDARLESAEWHEGALRGSKLLALVHQGGCALGEDGRVRCWGLNSCNQLGQPSPLDSGVRTSERALEVPGLRDVVSLSAGPQRACAVTRDGRLVCWGARPELRNYMLGTMSSPWRGQSAQPVKGLTNIRQLTISDDTNCALRDDGAAFCWGENVLGQLGDGTVVDRAVPVRVRGLSNAQDLACSASICCAGLADKTVSCWGLLDGRSYSNVMPEPRPVPSLTNVVDVVGGSVPMCFRHGDGAVSCFHASNLAPVSPDDHVVPPRTAARDAEQLAVGTSHACLRDRAGRVRCWGWNYDGVIGLPTMGASSYTPVTIPNLGPRGTLFAGSFSMYDVTPEGTVFGWGSAIYDKKRPFVPAKLTNLGSDVVAVAHGNGRVCVLRRDGTVACEEQLRGVGAGKAMENVQGMTDIVEIEVGQFHLCGRTRAGGVVCAGGNEHGQRGDGAMVCAAEPFEVR
ncbi:hypothetical protein [Sorangium sp. So ce131]|uniref:hypothetical protein n=1 Tax=Sorangium sp. So ce131 TaxID=3133282 RepID=UPI003F611CBE